MNYEAFWAETSNHIRLQFGQFFVRFGHFYVVILLSHWQTDVKISSAVTLSCVFLPTLFYFRVENIGFCICVCWQLWYWYWKCIIQTKRLIQWTENESPVGLQASLGPDVWREVVGLGLGPGLQPGRALQSLERARSNRRARFGLGLRQVFESSLYP